MIVIKDLSQKGLDELNMKLGSVCYNVADMGAPETYKVTLSDQVRITYVSSGLYVYLDYEDRDCILNLSDFASMEIL